MGGSRGPVSTGVGGDGSRFAALIWPMGRLRLFAMQVKLVVLKGGTKVRDIKLRLPTIVGRGRNCSLQLPHPLVSRQHCEIFESDGKLIVRDLGSLNGTFLNDQKITESEAPPGSKLTIGVVTFCVEYADSSGPAAASPAEVPAVESASMPATAPAPSAPAPQAIPAHAPLAAPMAVPLATAPMAFPPGSAAAAPMARPVTFGPSPGYPTPQSPALAIGPAVPYAGAPRVGDEDNLSESTRSADENRAGLETAPGPMGGDMSPEEFVAHEPGEDRVEVVDDAANLLPPVAVPPTPTLPAMPFPASPTPAGPASPADSPAANSTERPATADSEQDLLVFLKSLGK